jgi:nitroimidazol reductase NimA-like FMN-containing flavoprotein (pyridoxamine 5'-phosphate oxidase superfamily)
MLQNKIADDKLLVTERTTLHRHPERGSFDCETVYRILDEALICHVAFAVGSQPVVVPTLFARVGDTLYIHGSAIGRMLRSLAEGIEVCVNITLLDGLVFARSAFSHSMNYRSVSVFGTAREVTDAGEKRRALEATVEHVAKGRWQDARQPNEKELAVTTVIAVPLGEASAKIRSGGPKDADVDYALPVWAGVVPLTMTALAPVTDERAVQREPPAYVTSYRR